MHIGYLFRVGRTWGVLLALFALVTASCATGSKARLPSSPELAFGLSRAQLAANFAQAGQYEFTALHNGSVYECVIYSFVREYNEYLFVFRDDKLTSISRAMDFHNYEVVDSRETEVSWSTEDKLKAIVTAPGLSVEEFIGSVKKRAEEQRSRKPSVNILPAFTVLSPLLVPVGIPAGAGSFSKRQRWISMYDPKKVEIGMTLNQVEHAFGSPKFGDRSGNEMTLAYGPAATVLTNKDAALSVDTSNRGYWVAVVLAENKVTAILSDDFFNALELVRPKNALKENQLPE